MEENIIKIPPEAITFNMIKAFLETNGPASIEKIPIPNAFTNYNEQYEDVVIYAISMLEEDYLNKREGVVALEYDIFYNFLDKIPKEYRTNKVVLEAIKKHPKYLDYADFENENFDELLQIGYRKKLESIGRSELSEQEIKLMKKFFKNNSKLFSTLDLDCLNPDIVNSIGESSLEKIVRYRYVQRSLIELAKDKEVLTIFSFALENLKQDNLFIEPLIEKLADSLSLEKDRAFINSGNFIKLASNRIQDKSHTLTEEERTIISYLALNPQEIGKIQTYDDILNFVSNKDAELERIIGSRNSSLIDVKNAYLQRIVGMDYASVVKLVMQYGNDPEELLAKYEGKELGSYKEKAEKEALEIIIKLKSVIEEKDLRRIQQEYVEYVKIEDKTKSFERYQQAIILDNTLRRAYGRDITQTLSEHGRENNVEYVERTEDGQEYLVRKMNGPFSRMISVMEAYRKSAVETESDMYDRWNTSKMAENHALCYSFINESNPGTALLGDRKGVIISVSGFDAEAVTAVAPYDLCSDSRQNTTITYRQQKFYTANNLPNQTRSRYSEVDIEIQDVSGGGTEYKKIQPSSIICFEEVDENSIKAAIELSKKLGRTIPIELIDRRELATQTRQEIDNLLKKFKSGENLQPELVGQIITKFNNTRNAHVDSSLSGELIGEFGENRNPDAIFNKAQLNKILLECIEVTKQRMENGEIQQGLEAITQIKQFIMEDREKNVLQPTMSEKQYVAGIAVDVDYRLDEIQRLYSPKKIPSATRNITLEILQGDKELDSATFETIYGRFESMPKQLSFAEFQDSIDLSKIKSTAEEVHQEGYYSENKSYSEEHITRVAMFSSAIANLEGADDKTKSLLHEAVKYYSSGRRLEFGDEQHQEYSAKIAGQELSGKYSETDVGIIQASIELQKFRYSLMTSEIESKRKEKIGELCEKYGLDISDGERIGCIAKYIRDGTILDKTRFITKVAEEKFNFEDLETDAAKSLVKVSYSIQDELSTEHLKELSRVALINFEVETQDIMEEFFTIQFGATKRNLYDESIVSSPIVREAYLKHKFQEIDFERAIEFLPREENIFEQTENMPPIPPPPSEPPPHTKPHNLDVKNNLLITSSCMEGARKIAESRSARNLTRISQEIRTAYLQTENANRNREAEKEEI